MSICNEIEEGCNLPSSPNDIKILLKQIKTDLKTLMEDTEAKLLLHDRKIGRVMQIFKR